MQLHVAFTYTHTKFEKVFDAKGNVYETGSVTVCSIHITDVSSRSHPEQLPWLSSSYSVEVWRVHRLYLYGDLVGQQFVKTLFSIFC